MGEGILSSIGVVLGYLFIISLVAGIIALVCVSFLQPQWQMQDALETMRTTFGMNPAVRVEGFQASRGVVGQAADIVPNLADLVASRSVVSPATQEVIMTGMPSHTCLGGDDEVMLVINNNIGADQLDVSYAFENLNPTSSNVQPQTLIPARVVKVASCGKESVIRQCIPIAPNGRGVRLHTLAYYYEAESQSSNSPNSTASVVREEARIYPLLLDNNSLKAQPILSLDASLFNPFGG